MKDPASGELQEKSVFVIFFSGEQICDAFGANRYPFPEEVQQQRQMASDVTSRLHELHATIQAGEMHLQTSIEPRGHCRVRKEKAVYHTLNKMNLDFTHKVLVAEAWKAWVRSELLPLPPNKTPNDHGMPMFSLPTSLLLARCMGSSPSGLNALGRRDRGTAQKTSAEMSSTAGAGTVIQARPSLQDTAVPPPTFFLRPYSSLECFQRACRRHFSATPL
eukprot:gene4061-14149_t